MASTRFAPLPGLAAAGQRQLQAGQVSELHEVYGGLGSGRLVIAGGPGSGKSSAAVLLILAALRHRRSVPAQVRPEVPVPVMFTLHGWDPGTRRARDWLAERLRQAYPLFGGRQGAVAARGLLDEGRIAVILDGLDEIPEDLRPAVLQALSQQATFRLVLLTRSAEMADAAARAVLQGAAAVELQDIDPGAAAGYLTRTQLDPPPRGWQDLTRRLRHEPGSPLARALNNPLMLTLVRDTYRAGDEASELLGLRDAAGHPASSQDIADHLLDRVLPAAYTQQPGEPPPRYDLATAERALRCIAARMNNDRTRDLQWWRVPAWAHAAPRIIATGLVAGIVTEVSAWTYFGVNAHFLDATMYYLTALAATLVVAFGIASVRWRQLFRRRLLMVGLLAGLLAGAYAELDSARFLTELVAALVVAFGLLFGRGDKVPKRIASVRWRQLFRRRPLVVGLLTGLLAGTYAKLNPPLGYPAALAAGLAAGLVAWLGAGLVAGMSRPGADSTSPLTPLASWRSDRAFGLAAGLVSGLAAGLAPGLLFGVINGIEFGEFGAGLHEGLQTALRYGLVVGFGSGLRIRSHGHPPSRLHSSLCLTGFRFASCGSWKTPTAAASCARWGPSTSSATLACKTAWPTRNGNWGGASASPTQLQKRPQRPQRKHCKCRRPSGVTVAGVSGIFAFRVLLRTTRSTLWPQCSPRSVMSVAQDSSTRRAATSDKGDTAGYHPGAR